MSDAHVIAAQWPAKWQAGIPTPNAQIEKSEWRFVALVALGLLVVASIPYVIAYTRPDPTGPFQGHLTFDPDFNAYFGFIRQAKQGQWLFYNPFTPEPHNACFFNLEWLLIGKLAALTHAALPAALHCVHAVSVVLLCVAFYRLASLLFQTVLMRRVVLLMAMTGGGFGWLLQIPGLDAPGRIYRFMDLYAGLHPFFWIIAQPHWLVVQAFNIAALWVFLEAERSGKRMHYALTGLLLLAVGAMRPWDMVYLLAGIGLYTAIVTRPFFRPWSPQATGPLVALLLPAPLILYYLWLFRIHPVFRWYYIQNVGQGPLPLQLALGSGLVAVLFLLHLGHLGNFQGKPAAHILIPCCALASLLLMNLHPLISNAWQFHQTFLIPALLVGVMTLERPLQALLGRTRWAYAGLGCLLAINSLTSWVLVGRFSKEAIQGRFRIDQRVLDALGWLEQHIQPRDTVLSSCEMGNLIPRYTTAVTVCGYAISTVAYEERKAALRQFFSAAAADDYRRQLLAAFRPRYVLFGPSERGNRAFDPQQASFLLRRYSNPVVDIYEACMSDETALAK